MVLCLQVLADVRSMKGKQENVDSRLNTMKRENEALWREVASLRQKHMKQQQIVNKLIQFLISIVQPNGRAGLGLKRRYAKHYCKLNKITLHYQDLNDLGIH